LKDRKKTRDKQAKKGEHTMGKRLFTAFVIFFCFMIIFPAGAGPDIKEGLWEIKTQTKMQGMTMPPVTHTQCMSNKTLVPQNVQSGQDCEISQTKTKGNTVTWTMECRTQGGAMKGTGEITYEGDRFKGTMTMTMEEAGMKITNTLSGRRIGACK
jgi:hypothetical protein